MKMDLLRLVLARQDLEALFRLPRLLHSESFVKIRRSIVNVRTNFSDYIRQCTVEGELCRASVFHVSCTDLRNRAVFLRGGGYYRFFCTAARDPDVWYALESRVPEIQAAALVYSRISSSATNNLIYFTNLSSIPWTTELRRQILRLIIPQTEYGRTMSLLMGYLGYHPARGVLQRLDYFQGGRSNALDRAFASGDPVAVINAVKSFDKQLDRVDQIKKAVFEAIYSARLVTEFCNLYPEFVEEALNKIRGPLEWSYPRNHVNRIIGYLADQNFATNSSTAAVAKLYEERMSQWVNRDLRTAILGELGGYDQSVQQMAIAGTPFSMGGIRGRLGFLRGQTIQPDWNTSRADVAYHRNSMAIRNKKLFEFLRESSGDSVELPPENEDLDKEIDKIAAALKASEVW